MWELLLGLVDRTSEWVWGDPTGPRPAILFVAMLAGIVLSALIGVQAAIVVEADPESPRWREWQQTFRRFASHPLGMLVLVLLVGVYCLTSVWFASVIAISMWTGDHDLFPDSHYKAGRQVEFAVWVGVFVSIAALFHLLKLMRHHQK